jgi:Ca2+-binding EF-hand superfamily protein
MTSRYTPARAVPPGFPDVLRDFSREVLRNYPRGRNAPADSQAFILEFAARYFANGGKPPAALKIKKQEGRATGAGSSAPGGSSKHQAVAALDDLENRIQQLFRAADRDNSGQLDPREMKAVLHALGSEIGLQQSDVRLLVSLGDTNGDGLISYPEFIPLAVQIISLIAAKAKEAQERGATKASAMIGAEYALVHGFTSVELQNRLLDAFRLVDQDADGLVSYEELNAALGGSGLGLSRKDINLITSEAMEFDTNGDGRLNFAELAPMVFGLLADNIAKQLEIELVSLFVVKANNGRILWKAPTSFLALLSCCLLFTFFPSPM